MNKKKKIVIMILLGMIILVILTILIYYRITPINLKQENVHSIFINVDLNTCGKYISGIAEINDYDKIKEAIRIIESLKAYKGKSLDKKLSGDSPSAYIHVYNEKGDETDYIYFYYDILRYNEEFYRIGISQYNKLAELCSKYGECRLSP